MAYSPLTCSHCHHLAFDIRHFECAGEEIQERRPADNCKSFNSDAGCKNSSRPLAIVAIKSARAAAGLPICIQARPGHGSIAGSAMTTASAPRRYANSASQLRLPKHQNTSPFPAESGDKTIRRTAVSSPSSGGIAASCSVPPVSRARSRRQKRMLSHHSQPRVRQFALAFTIEPLASNFAVVMRRSLGAGQGSCAIAAAGDQHGVAWLRFA